MSLLKRITTSISFFFFSSLIFSAFPNETENLNLPIVSNINGEGNNPQHPLWGNPGQQFVRRSHAAYSDGISAPAGKNRPSARLISNIISAQGDEETHDDRNMSAYVYSWGQFIDHDLTITFNTPSKEPFNILVPKGDEHFDPNRTGNKKIILNRTEYDLSTGTSIRNPRQQLNHITSYLDGSVVYGSDDMRARALRTMKFGLLKTSPGNLLPLNNKTYFPIPLANANDAHVVPDDKLFVAGDTRSNENVELMAVHTLFMREHNWWAKKIFSKYPSLNDEQIYQYARAIVRAEIQAITYNEWLPTLLGINRLTPYNGFKPNINPGISIEFSTAALRIGHTLLATDIEFMDNDGNDIRAAIDLKEAFFNPTTIKEVGVDSLLKYLATANASKVDTLVIDDVRNFLFGLPGQGGLDLPSLNIQRGRDHGLSDYNSTRVAFNLAPVNDFDEITPNMDLQNKLKNLYGNVNNIDAWVGGLSESHGSNTSMGPFFTRIFVDQFIRLRDGDRFWYENIFTGKDLERLQRTKLTDIVKRNTKITNIQENAFIFNASISGRVYWDNKIDKQEELKNISIELIDVEEGEVVDTVKTNTRGYYKFYSIHEAGPYKVRVRKYKTTTQNPMKVQISRGGEMTNMNFGVIR
jgi:peroxidase